MATTTNPKDPRIPRGVNSKPRGQAERHLVLPSEDRRNPQRPFRDIYTHRMCGSRTWVEPQIAETFAASPTFYGLTYCCSCRRYLPVSEFEWDDGTLVGS